MTPEQWGVASFILQLASFGFMVQPVAWPRAGRTRQVPPRLSWLIWVLLYQVMFWSTKGAGARGSLWIVGAEVVGTLTMFLLSLKWGAGSLLLLRITRDPGRAPRLAVPSRPELLVFLGAAVSLAGWQLTSSAALGVVLSVAVDTIAAIPLLGVAWRAPWTQSRLGWAVSGLASLAAIFAVAPGQGLVLYAYPVAGVSLDVVVVAVLLAAYYRLAGRKALFRSAQVSSAPERAVTEISGISSPVQPG